MSTSQTVIGNQVSANTQAILLLTAPLITGRGQHSTELLTASEYAKLARFLHQKECQPADLVVAGGSELVLELGKIVNSDRLKRLVARGFLLSQAIERWQARSIWVVSRSDEAYPARLKERLKDLAPPVLYGCGDSAILNTGGLAVVGSRNADATILESTSRIGELAARAQRTIVSGGARGVDQAAMSGGLEAGGKAAGVLAENLERAALNRDHRNYLRDGQLVLLSPYDPQAGFNVGNAMQRNKLIYALADAALVVQSDYGKGGTWAGAIEQVERLRLVPVYTFPHAQHDMAFEHLAKKGALTWPNPNTPEDFSETLAGAIVGRTSLETERFSFSADNGRQSDKTVDEQKLPATSSKANSSSISPDEQLFATVRTLLEQLDAAKTDKEIADKLKVKPVQAKEWIKRLVKEGTLQKLSKPTRYYSTKNSKLF
jgi:predicted Rossmann fold nucleotide-binding protein DprA/Smf involved in DNA uptake